MGILSSEDMFEKIKDKFNLFQNKIKIDSHFNHHNLKLYGENFYRDILNIINTGADFENTNALKSNFPAIDLICHVTKKCIQITSNRSKEKIEDTIEKFKILEKDELKEKYSIEIYYLLDKAKPQKIPELEQKLGVKNLSSKLKDSDDLLSKIENLTTQPMERVLKLFVVKESFIDKYNKAILSIEKEIDEITVLTIQLELIDSLADVRDYFKCNLDLLIEILKQIDCETGIHKKNNHEVYASMVKFLIFLILSKTFSNSAIYPKHKYKSTLINSFKSWIFNSSNSIKNLDFHFAKIARYVSSNPNTSIDDGICYITSLRDNGGLSCDTCTNGLLANSTSQINNIITDYTDIDSNNILSSNKNFMKLRNGKQIDFKCGECISNIDEHMKAKKIFMEII